MFCAQWKGKERMSGSSPALALLFHRKILCSGWAVQQHVIVKITKTSGKLPGNSLLAVCLFNMVIGKHNSSAPETLRKVWGKESENVELLEEGKRIKKNK